MCEALDSIPNTTNEKEKGNPSTTQWACLLSFLPFQASAFQMSVRLSDSISARTPSLLATPKPAPPALCKCSPQTASRYYRTGFKCAHPKWHLPCFCPSRLLTADTYQAPGISGCPSSQARHLRISLYSPQYATCWTQLCIPPPRTQMRPLPPHL